MKKLRLGPERAAVGTAACGISAAALMLGVSHAATIGFNFQCNYCSLGSYSGAIVSGTAFGIATNSWESLSPMNTGYCGTPGSFSLTNTVDSSTARGAGLNPIPNGSLTVAWSAFAASVSGFGGYTRPGPHYDFVGFNYQPGNEQVYWGFLRDGVNLGFGSVGGDNDKPGYNIDIVGLKSLFTNSPFVVQLVASSDSMQYLTNAFVIDGATSGTQSVVYPSTPPVDNTENALWVGGNGGGLSTVSTALDTDHIQIIGNRAAHDTVNGSYNFASTIAGFIITDQPVVTMSPNSALANPGDTLVLSAYAIGVPPVSYQWRQDGAPIPGATTLSYGFTNAALANAGGYDLVASNAFGVTTSAVATVTVDRIAVTGGQGYVADSNSSNPPHDGVATATAWVASNTDAANTNRTGVMQFIPANPSQIVVSTGTNLDNAQGTILFWLRTPGLSDPSGNPEMVFDRRSGNGMVVTVDNTGSLVVQGSGFDDITSLLGVADDLWHHVAITYDLAAGGAIAVYIDGVFDSGNGSTGGNRQAWTWPTGRGIDLGLSPNLTYQPLQGFLDDLRIYSRNLTGLEIQTVLNSGGIVDSAALVLELNFDAPPTAGVTLSWQCLDAILQSADTVEGPYTDVLSSASPYSRAAQQAKKFYRYRGHTPVTTLTNPYLM